MWPFQEPEDAFRGAVRAHFGLLANECGASLRQVDDLVFGFATDVTILTIGIYPGHFRSVCVKLRPRAERDDLREKGGEIGLANFELFATGQISKVYDMRQRWASAPLREEVEALANKVRQVALPFLIDKKADWEGLRAMVAERVEQALRSRRSHPSG